jgi:hypothetical protein
MTAKQSIIQQPVIRNGSVNSKRDDVFWVISAYDRVGNHGIYHATSKLEMNSSRGKVSPVWFLPK